VTQFVLGALAAAGSSMRQATVEDVQAALEAMRSKEDGSAVRRGAIPTTVAAGRSRGLIRWFSIGFTCACVAGGIALRAAVANARATAAAPPAAPPLGLPPPPY